MIKVKEFLDENFICHEESKSNLKKNGHYEVFGQWSFPSIECDNSFFIRCNCNNETLQIWSVKDGKVSGHYSYLQTYAHIPRGEADHNGYYRRSTDDEVIRYLKSLMVDYIRNEKISSIFR